MIREITAPLLGMMSVTLTKVQTQMLIHGTFYNRYEYLCSILLSGLMDLQRKGLLRRLAIECSHDRNSVWRETEDQLPAIERSALAVTTGTLFGVELKICQSVRFIDVSASPLVLHGYTFLCFTQARRRYTIV